MKHEVFTRLSRNWDAFDAYLFDIDGTLIKSTDAIHYFAFCEALLKLSGRPLTLEGVVTHGNTDVGILRDALMLGGVQETTWRPHLRQALTGMRSFVTSQRQNLCAIPLPSVSAVLKHLTLRGACLGVATGNLAVIGHLKLDAAGLLHYFEFGGYSDEFEYRHDVFRRARSLALAAGKKNATLCVVGDTPEDIRSAHACGMEIIAVATGIHSYERLSAGNPELCLHTLSELSGIVQD